MSEIRGVITAMATVFGEGGGVDLVECRKLARYLIDHGSHGLVVAGTTGESPTLDDQEKLELLKAVIDEVGETAPVIFGSGSNDTRHSVELTKAGADVGADASLLTTPYYNLPTQEGLRAHFEAIAAGSPDLPLILYNIPSRVVVNMDPGFLAELAQIPTVVGVKQANEDEIEAIPGMDLIAGNDTAFMPVLKAGGTAGILVASHLAGPRMREMWDLFQAGDVAGAETVDASLGPVYRATGVTTNPIALKAALEMAGVCSARMRLPMVEAGQAEKDEIRRLMSEAGMELG